MYVITYSTILGVLRKVSIASGSKELVSVFENLEKEHDTPAMNVIATAVELTYQHLNDVRSIKQRYERLSGNAVVRRMIQELIVHHLYIYPADEKSEPPKHQIASAFGIPVRTQLVIERRKAGKLLSKR